MPKNNTRLQTFHFFRSICPRYFGKELPLYIMQCLKQTRLKQYKGRVDRMEYNWKNYKAIIFEIVLKSDMKWVHEEVYLLDEIGLLGSIGGSLGLFVGFSF